jgi:hypothetical protein
MQDVFSWVFPLISQKLFQVTAWVKEERKPIFESCTLQNGDKEIQVSSEGWKSSNLLFSLRFARFQSAVMDVCTVLIFPVGKNNNCPIFVIELVAIKDRIHLFIVDIELDKNSFTEENFSKEIKGLKKWRSYFTYIEDKPLWYTKNESKYSIYTKANINQTNAIQNCIQDYFTFYMDCHFFSTIKSLTNTELKDSKHIKEYKKTHADFSPARSVISDVKWLEEFIYENHFKIFE